MRQRPLEASEDIRVLSLLAELKKDFKKSPRRIDLAMASIMAFDRATELVGKTIKFY